MTNVICIKKLIKKPKKLSLSRDGTRFVLYAGGDKAMDKLLKKIAKLEG